MFSKIFLYIKYIINIDENIDNYRYIDILILRIYWIYQNISTDILEKNIDRPKIDQNS